MRGDIQGVYQRQDRKDGIALKDEIAAFAEKDGNRILSQDIIEKLEKAYTANEIFDEIGKKYGYRRRENL